MLKTAKKSGKMVAEIKDSVAADGSSRTETQTVIGMLPQPVEVRTTYSRVARGPRGSHSISGKWRETQTDLTNHEEDTTYKASGNVTIEESDKKDGVIVQINRWSIDPEGTSIHARFDDTHGHIQEQTGHKVR